MFTSEYDLIVVGAGHAGSEAAAAAANMGAKVLLITMNLQHIAQMSCNPAVGGIAKGQIVREIDALGGYMAIVTDKTAIQFKMLNQSKGPAMWSPRVQSDRMRFSEAWRLQLEALPTLDFFQGMVNDLLIEGEKVVGVRTSLGIPIKAKSVVLTNGTFLNGVMHIGLKQFGGGRAGEPAAYGLTECLVQHGFESGRMKTGTPPRVDARSLDFSKMIPQPGDAHPQKFSFSDQTRPLSVQKDCYMSYTSDRVHNILRTGFDRSPMFQGIIHGVGPRYCPSIEDKINRFADKERHPIFVEPEGWHTVEMYVNGFSTSLPEEVQYAALSQVAGFERVKFLRPGYAIEYDYFPPTQLKHTLETKLIENLYFAGQINGTTGYEEAAAQGLMAGINAILKVREREPFVLKRDQAYIGVLIDDLITKGTEEPYRMFTSRAEYRTLLRQDNADNRLTPLGYAIGTVDETRYRAWQAKEEKVGRFVVFLQGLSVTPQEVNPILERYNSAPMRQGDKLQKVLSRPDLTLADFEQLPKVSRYLEEQQLTEEEKTSAEVEVKYAGYIEKERNQADKLHRLENMRIPEHFDYDKVASLSFEGREKLKKIRPATLSQASRISGVSPADVSILLIYMGR
nr:tRNA uridine-5-carboxymethylaminomethyl(34) synthesis enzyme MnmG [uncultured Capnocytophaga sp.]